MRRSRLGVLFIFILLTTLFVPVGALRAEGTTTLRIHYHRPDGEYGPWNLWIWPQGSEGKAYEFDEEDDFGRVATVELPGTHKRVGFIVRTNEWKKDIEADRFVEEFSSGFAEIWLQSGDPTIYSAPPTGFAEVQLPDRVQLTVNYYRYDGEYDGWNLWLWPQGQEGRGVSFEQSTDGVVAKATFENLQDLSSIGIIVRKSTPSNNWAAKDVEQDRFIPLFRSDREGNIEVWMMQNDPIIYYRASDLDRSPRLVAALIDDPNTISVETNVPFNLAEGDKLGFRLSANDVEVEIAQVQPVGKVANERTRLVTITTVEPIDLDANLVLEKTNYEGVAVSFGAIFSSKAFEEKYHYAGNDLGAVYTPTATRFRVWAPTATKVELVTYTQGQGGTGEVYPMIADVNGTWVQTILGDQHGLFYNYRVMVGGQVNEAVDPYARAVGVNGDRGMVIDLSRTNPPGFTELQKPEFADFVDAIIYELHVRDLSIHPDSGITQKGKFLGLIEEGTRGPSGVKTGLDHLVELGITHLHLLPSFDYATVDETRLDRQQFNWGYDPKNYNVPEGSYSTDPYDGEVRVREFKQMVQGLNEAGIRVVMDVVYNHTSRSGDSHLNLIVPGYYYRMTPEGGFSNGSGCGNELADERSMVRKMIVDSVVYWATEYKVDGFRFDLMGLHHVDTMNEVRATVDEIDSSILIYGEGWTGGATPLRAIFGALKTNVRKIPGIAVFSDDMRDGIKGHVFNDREPGFVNGGLGLEESVKFGIVAGTDHGQVKYRQVNYSSAPWALEPAQSINYAEAHDNLTLWDKLLKTNPQESEAELLKMHKMASALVLTSQGVPFLHAGQDLVRTKFGDSNSYQSPDEINRIDWSRKVEYGGVFAYHQGLVQLRKAHPAFRMITSAQIREHLTFLEMPARQMVGYSLTNHANNDSWQTIVVLFNATLKEQTVILPGENWVVVVDGERAGIEQLAIVQGSVVIIPARSTLVLVDQESFEK